MQMLNEDEADGVAGATEARDVGDTEAARVKAESILAKDRATVNEIAWAWVTLLDLQAGNEIQSGEARYRKILFAKEEIENLGLLKTDEVGFPVRKYNGVPVSGMNDRADIKGLVSVRSVREAMTFAGGKWPVIAIPTAEVAAIVKHSTTEPRQPFAYMFERAIDGLRKAGVPIVRAAVWDELKKLALNEEGPFLGVEGNEIQYTDINGKKAGYKQEAFRGWWRRHKGEYA